MSATTPRDPYEVLGVARDAGEQDIKKAFRRLARELHPDVNAHDPQAEEKFKEAAEAYEILSDPGRRSTYDRYGHDGLRTGGYSSNFDGFGSIGDLFNAFFGADNPFAASGGSGGGDVSVTIEIELADAAAGTKVEVRFEAVDRCEHCHGNGAEPGTPIERCGRCNGAGQVQSVTRTPFGQMVRTGLCEACHGEGRLPTKPCHECRGRGRRRGKRLQEITIPPGISDGQRVRVNGAGNAGEHGAGPGDLYVLVRVKGDERFVRDGDDLVTVLDLPSPLASLGTTLQAPTLDGPLPVEIPAGSQPGEILTMRGKGMPSLRRQGRHGDLRIVLNVIVPRRLTDEQREIYDQLHQTLTEENLSTDEPMLSKLRRMLRHHST